MATVGSRSTACSKKPRGLGILPEFEQQQADPLADGDGSRIDSEIAAIKSQRFPGVAVVFKVLCEFQLHRVKLGVELGGPAVMRGGFRRSARAQQGLTQPQLRVGGLRVEVEGLFVGVRGCFRLAELERGVGEVEGRSKFVGPGFAHRAEVRSRLAELASLHQQDPEVHVGFGEPGFQPDDLAVVFDGLVALLELGVAIGKVELNLDVFRLLDNDCLEQGRGRRPVFLVKRLDRLFKIAAGDGKGQPNKRGKRPQHAVILAAGRQDPTWCGSCHFRRSLPPFHFRRSGRTPGAADTAG